MNWNYETWHDVSLLYALHKVTTAIANALKDSPQPAVKCGDVSVFVQVSDGFLHHPNKIFF